MDKTRIVSSILRFLVIQTCCLTFFLMCWLVYKFTKRNTAYIRPNRLSRILQFIFEEPLILPQLVNHSNEPNKHSSNDFINFVKCSCGLIFFYTLWGLLQERIMTKQYGHQGQKFIHTQFVILCNRVANLILAYCLCKNKDHVMAPQTASYKIVMASWSNSLSSWFQYESLMFVCFPIVVLGKSFKIVPVMILSRCLLTHKYSTLQYCSASIVSSGLWIFLNGVGNRTETGMQDKESIHITFGLVLILFYISFDAFTSNWQKRLLSVSSDRAIGRYQLMFWFNAWSALICFVGLIPTVDQVLQFIITHGLNSRFLFHICTLSTCSAAGQWFVYRTLDCFGPVVFASIMAFRQMLSAFISCIVYKHQLSLKGWLGLLTISIGVGMFISSNRKDTSKTSLKTIDKV